MRSVSTPVGTFDGDWRSGHYGADRRAHLFDWQGGGGVKRVSCDVRLSLHDTAPVTGRKVSELCIECRRNAGLEAFKPHVAGVA